MMVDIAVALLGAIIGSFLNVCIVRLPHEESVVHPRSHCRSCRRPIAWRDNIPVLSYLILRGRCRHCGASISWRYPFVEALTAAAFWGLYRYYGLTPVFGAYALMVGGFIVATFVDFEHRIIPDEVSLGGALAGVICSLAIPALHGVPDQWGWHGHIVSLGRSLLGLLVGGGSIYLMGLLGELIFRKEAMGGGDVKLMAMIGAFLGWKLVLITFFLAPFFGAVYGIIEKIRTKDSAIAYGPFLILAALISLFWGQTIIFYITGQYRVFQPFPPGTPFI